MEMLVQGRRPPNHGCGGMSTYLHIFAVLGEAVLHRPPFIVFSRTATRATMVPNLVRSITTHFTQLSLWPDSLTWSSCVSPLEMYTKQIAGKFTLMGWIRNAFFIYARRLFALPSVCVCNALYIIGRKVHGRAIAGDWTAISMACIWYC
jgi:hypothetical protein